MRRHPWLLAYMAGITLPCVLLLFLLTGVVMARHVYHVMVPIEKVLVFPMAVVPSIWGLWNALHVALQGRRRLPLGLHGAVLPFLLAPLAEAVTRWVGVEVPEPLRRAFPFAFPAIVVVFYLLWKHAVGFLNELLGIA